MVEKQDPGTDCWTFKWMFILFSLLLCVGTVNLSTSTTVDGVGHTSPPVSIPESSNVTTESNVTVVPNGSSTMATPTTTPGVDYSYLGKCPNNTQCNSLGGDCIECRMNHYCIYGTELTSECTVKSNITCNGPRTFSKTYQCRYCYQLDHWLYACSNSSDSCTVKTAPKENYLAQCTVHGDIICLGNRTFTKSLPCNWTSGYKWSTALILSITLGGFGVDRFYLGLWREGIGKLFSFGGLGVWTIVDVILIAVGYIGPYDGSHYIYPWN